MASESNLDAGSSIFLPKTISSVLEEVSMMDDRSKKWSKLDCHIQSLEEELRKINAFERELPHCMHLLRDAIERLKEERSQVGPAMEELMPLKGSRNSEGGAGAKGSNDEKKNWLSSVQLWSTPVQYDPNIENKNQEPLFTLRSRCQQEEEGSECGYTGGLLQGCELKNRGGAFLPFKKAIGVTINEDKRPVQLHHGLSLSINPVANEWEPIDLSSVKHESGSIRPQLQEPHQQQQQRKQRRCWSPELHRRFVDALQQLGGAQTATPKQIRELMKVDGLTNDEVKSHLQKYRLHIRKLPSPISAGDYSWLTRDLGTHSGSPQDHLNLRGSAKGGGSGNGGDSMEDEEDDKLSESRSWKKTA